MHAASHQVDDAVSQFSPSEIYYIAIGTLLSLDDDDDDDAVACSTQGKCSNTCIDSVQGGECDHS